jgi:hypothetical protein
MDNITLTVTNNGKELRLTLPDEMDIEEWSDQFKTILSWLTFHPDTIKELFYEEEIQDKAE